MFDQITDPHLAFIFLSIWSVIALPVLWYWKLLALPKDGKPTAKIVLMSPLIGFLLFVGACAFIPGWTNMLLHYLNDLGVSSFSELELKKFPQLLGLVVSCILLVGFGFIHSKEVYTRIWGQQKSFVPLMKGVGYSLLTFPLVMLLVQGIHQVVEFLGYQYSQQVAIEELKSMHESAWLFVSFTVAIVTIVPVIEEFLFRGLLQNFCADFLGNRAAIIIASLFFALFHYSGAQGATNIELMVGLVVYSYFMGVFYVKERSLWTTIGMHGTFNGLSILCMALLPESVI